MRYLMMIIAMAFVLTACSSAPTNVTAEGASGEQTEEVALTADQQAIKEFVDSQVVCTYERPVGSHFKTRVCRTRDEIERMRRKGQEAYRQIESTSMQQGLQ